MFPCMYACLYKQVQELVEDGGIRFPGNYRDSGYEPPNVGVGKSTLSSYPLGHLSSPCYLFISKGGLIPGILAVHGCSYLVWAEILPTIKPSIYCLAIKRLMRTVSTELENVALETVLDTEGLQERASLSLVSRQRKAWVSSWEGVFWFCCQEHFRSRFYSLRYFFSQFYALISDLSKLLLWQHPKVDVVKKKKPSLLTVLGLVFYILF